MTIKPNPFLNDPLLPREVKLKRDALELMVQMHKRMIEEYAKHKGEVRTILLVAALVASGYGQEPAPKSLSPAQAQAINLAAKDKTISLLQGQIADLKAQDAFHQACADAKLTIAECVLNSDGTLTKKPEPKPEEPPRDSRDD